MESSNENNQPRKYINFFEYLNQKSLGIPRDDEGGIVNLKIDHSSSILEKIFEVDEKLKGIFGNNTFERNCDFCEVKLLLTQKNLEVECIDCGFIFDQCEVCLKELGPAKKCPYGVGCRDYSKIAYFNRIRKRSNEAPF